MKKQNYCYLCFINVTISIFMNTTYLPTRITEQEPSRYINYVSNFTIYYIIFIHWVNIEKPSTKYCYFTQILISITFFENIYIYSQTELLLNFNATF